MNPVGGFQAAQSMTGLRFFGASMSLLGMVS